MKALVNFWASTRIMVYHKAYCEFAAESNGLQTKDLIFYDLVISARDLSPFSRFSNDKIPYQRITFFFLEYPVRHPV